MVQLLLGQRCRGIPRKDMLVMMLSQLTLLCDPNQFLLHVPVFGKQIVQYSQCRLQVTIYNIQKKDKGKQISNFISSKCFPEIVPILYSLPLLTLMPTNMRSQGKQKRAEISIKHNFQTGDSKLGVLTTSSQGYKQLLLLMLKCNQAQTLLSQRVPRITYTYMTLLSVSCG